MSEISKTADRALAILAELADAEVATPQQLALRMGVNRTVMQRLLTTLLGRGFVTRSGGEYSLDPRLRTLAGAVQPGLSHAVHPHDTDLSARIGETVVFQILDGSTVIVLRETVQVHQVSLQVRHDVGSRSSISQSASGLAILAETDVAARTRLLDKAGRQDPELSRRLDAVKESGFASTTDELGAGISGLARAVHQHGAVVGCLAVLVPASHDGPERFRDDLKRAVTRIEAVLG